MKREILTFQLCEGCCRSRLLPPAASAPSPHNSPTFLKISEKSKSSVSWIVTAVLNGYVSADFLQQWKHIWHLLLSSIKDFFWSSLSRESIVLLDFGVLKRQSINVATEIATRFKKNLEGENRRSGTGGAMLGGDLGSESASLLKSRSIFNSARLHWTLESKLTDS